MANEYTVRSESDFAPVYDEDDMVSIRRGDLRAVLDVATGSMDFGSGFLDNEQVEALRTVAVVLHIDPIEVTPSNFACLYQGHDWAPYDRPESQVGEAPRFYCRRCHQYRYDAAED